MRALRDPGPEVLGDGLDHWIAAGEHDVILGSATLRKVWSAAIDRALADGESAAAGEGVEGVAA